MCGHGTIGLAVTLAHMGRLKPGRHRFETPVGVVGVELDRRAARRRSRMSRAIVSPKRSRSRLRVSAPCAATSPGAATGSSSLRTAPCDLEFANVGPLTRPRPPSSDALKAQGVRGKDGALIDHIEFFALRAIERREQPQFRPLPRRGLRPVALRNRNQRQARLPPRRRESCGPAKSGCRKASSAAAFAPASNRVRPAAFSRASAGARSSAPKASWCRTPWTRSGTEFAVRSRLNHFCALVILRLTAKPAPWPPSVHRRPGASQVALSRSFGETGP